MSSRAKLSSAAGLAAVGAFLIVGAPAPPAGAFLPLATLQEAGAGPGRPFAPERGRLRVEGPRFLDDEGHVWRWRGATGFLLFARYLDGEDITPQLDWLVAHGFNIVRVFGEVPGAFGADQAGVPGFERPFERPDFDAKLHAFFDLLADRGLRCEYTVLTYPDRMSVMREHVQRVFDVAASHWNVLIEVGNEPEHNQIDVLAVMAGLERRGVLTAYGLDPVRGSPETWSASVPVLDYGTTHAPRDFEASFYNTRSALEMQKVLGVPFVNDEPIGAIDPGHPLFVQTGAETWGGHRGGGARAVNRDLFISAATVAYMYTPGYTFHFQAGLEGRAPGPEMAVQNGVAAALREVARFVPGDAQLGTPVEPGDDGFGLALDGGPGAASLVGRAFGVVLGDRQWVVVPRPRPGWSPTAAAGWRIDEVGPVPYLLRLTRSGVGGH